MTLREEKSFSIFLICSMLERGRAGQELQKEEEEEEEVDFDKKEGGQFPGFKPSRLFTKRLPGPDENVASFLASCIFSQK